MKEPQSCRPLEQSGADVALTLPELFRTALAADAVGFTICTGRHPVIYSAKGVQSYDTQASASEHIEEILHQLLTSREQRQFRATRIIHFKSIFEDRVSLLGVAKVEGEEVRLELRKLAV